MDCDESFRLLPAQVLPLEKAPSAPPRSRCPCTRYTPEVRPCERVRVITRIQPSCLVRVRGKPFAQGQTQSWSP